MEHPGSFDQHHLDLLLETHETDVIERPVPVVVVKVAKVGAARAHLFPELPREGHAHVVLGRHPQGHVDLQLYGKTIKLSANKRSSLTNCMHTGWSN